MLGTVKLWCDPSIVQTSSHTVIGGLPRRSGEATIVARSFDDHRSRVFLGHAGFDVIGFWCAGGGCPSVIVRTSSGLIWSCSDWFRARPGRSCAEAPSGIPATQNKPITPTKANDLILAPRVRNAMRSGLGWPCAGSLRLSGRSF